MFGLVVVKESDLISLMDKNGIGTDATIAQHIKTILDRVIRTANEDNSTDGIIADWIGGFVY